MVHFMLLSFYIFVILIAAMVVVSIYNKQATETPHIVSVTEKPSKGVVAAWVMLAVVMVSLYVFFNGH